MKVIGGNFWLPVGELNNTNISLHDYLKSLGNFYYHATGRDSIYLVFRKLKNKKILLPDYICESIIQPLKKLKISYDFYHINENFKASIDEKFRNFDYIYIINYFGWVDESLYDFSKKMNIKIISDVTHLIFNEEKIKYVVGYSEYVIGSLRKSFSIPDGSFVISKKDVSPYNRIREDFVYKRTYGLISRYFSFLNDFKNTENLKILESSERILDNSASFGYNISFVSENIIKNIPIYEYMKKTKINFTYLEQELGVKYNFYSQYFPIMFKEKMKGIE